MINLEVPAAIAQLDAPHAAHQLTVLHAQILLLAQEEEYVLVAHILAQHVIQLVFVILA